MRQVISRDDFAEILDELVVSTKEAGPAADLREVYSIVLKVTLGALAAIGADALLLGR
jgi:hypothetical protein